ncbi:MAG: N-6 DNA methylase [Deltaproteobacteria bacterium]|nr:N-6 DNA methylase [Deltaproteobacteria bacterium]
MITGKLKSDIDKLWEAFWTGGITNPLTVIEQISFLMFVRLLDITETRNEKRAQRTGKPFKRVYREDQQDLRWSSFKQLGGAEMLPLVRDEVFKHLRGLGNGSSFGEYMADAQLMIQKPSLLVSSVNMVDDLPLTSGDAKGDLYEYLLSKLTTAGINGQFRTPRHIIRLMVEMLDPRPDETIADPACGTAGFLVNVMLYLLEKHSSEQGKIEAEDGSTIYTGDLLEPYREHIQSGMFHGFDFDVTMLRIAAMNLMLHGVEDPDIHYRDTLSNSFPEKFPAFAEDAFDVILANPPFKGSLDYKDVHPSLTRKVKTKKTELLFVALILRMLKTGGRSATIVPDGVLFGSSRVHVALRKMLLEDNQLEGVISLPSGVFKPYAGVSTAILVFAKGGKTDKVFFYDVKQDGYSLDDKRTAASEESTALGPVEGNDLPDVVEKWRARGELELTDRKAQAFFVSADEIREEKYDLSINRYKEIVYEEVEYEAPKVILGRLRALEDEIRSGLDELEGML